ncbi:hypothetical protein DIPPA_12606 [Diplonema papillatum]|nr:hypothetical protein DIPPA_12606 [Diplonema papillatum]
MAVEAEPHSPATPMMTVAQTTTRVTTQKKEPPDGGSRDNSFEGPGSGSMDQSLLSVASVFFEAEPHSPATPMMTVAQTTTRVTTQKKEPPDGGSRDNSFEGPGSGSMDQSLLSVASVFFDDPPAAHPRRVEKDAQISKESFLRGVDRFVACYGGEEVMKWIETSTTAMGRSITPPPRDSASPAPAAAGSPARGLTEFERWLKRNEALVRPFSAPKPGGCSPLHLLKEPLREYSDADADPRHAAAHRSQSAGVAARAYTHRYIHDHAAPEYWNRSTMRDFTRSPSADTTATSQQRSHSAGAAPSPSPRVGRAILLHRDSPVVSGLHQKYTHGVAGVVGLNGQPAGEFGRHRMHRRTPVISHEGTPRRQQGRHASTFELPPVLSETGVSPGRRTGDSSLLDAGSTPRMGREYALADELAVKGYRLGHRGHIHHPASCGTSPVRVRSLSPPKVLQNMGKLLDAAWAGALAAVATPQMGAAGFLPATPRPPPPTPAAPSTPPTRRIVWSPTPTSPSPARSTGRTRRSPSAASTISRCACSPQRVHSSAPRISRGRKNQYVWVPSGKSPPRYSVLDAADPSSVSAGHAASCRQAADAGGAEQTADQAHRLVADADTTNAGPVAFAAEGAAEHRASCWSPRWAGALAAVATPQMGAAGFLRGCWTPRPPTPEAPSTPRTRRIVWSPTPTSPSPARSTGRTRRSPSAASTISRCACSPQRVHSSAPRISRGRKNQYVWVPSGKSPPRYR